MNEIFKRRSIRKYTDKKVSEEDIEKVLRAAMCAPSAGNEQPWEFIVVEDRAQMNALMEQNPYSNMLKEASCAIVVCGDLSLQKFDYDFWTQDCAAATQNILLEAVSLGLGAVWLGTYPIKERTEGIQKTLDLPDNIVPFSVISVGHPNEKREPVDTFKPERIHRDRW